MNWPLATAGALHVMPPQRRGDALGLLMALTVIAEAAREAGWRVDLAVETGGDVERITFAAAKGEEAS